MKARHICAGLAMAATLLLAPAANAGSPNQPSERALTLWWVIFNYPEECATSPCGMEDLENPAAGPSVVYASGEIAELPGDVRVIASLYETGAGFADLDRNTSLIGGPGLVDSRAAEIHLVLRSHGPLTQGIALDQLTVFIDPGCQDVGGPNLCRDIQATIHQPAEQDVTVSDVLWLSDFSVVEDAVSRLIRLDGGVKFMLRTNILRRDRGR